MIEAPVGVLQSEAAHEDEQRHHDGLEGDHDRGQHDREKQVVPPEPVLCEPVAGRGGEEQAKQHGERGDDHAVQDETGEIEIRERGEHVHVALPVPHGRQEPDGDGQDVPVQLHGGDDHPEERETRKRAR